MSYYPITVTNPSTKEAYGNVQFALTLPSNFDFAGSTASGADWRLLDSDFATQLPFGRLNWSQSGKTGRIVGIIPTLGAGVTKTVYLQIGNASLSDASDAKHCYLSANFPTSNEVITETQVGANFIFVRTVTPQVQLDNGTIVMLVRSYQTGAGQAKVGVSKSTDLGVTFDYNDLLVPTGAAGDKTRWAFAFGKMTDGTCLMAYGKSDGAPLLFSNISIAKLDTDGVTWHNLTFANPIPIPVGYDGYTPYGRIRQRSSDGSFLMTVYATKTGDATSFTCTLLLRCPAGSDPTNGGNWTLLSEMARDSTGVTTFDETDFIEYDAVNHHWLAVLTVGPFPNFSDIFKGAQAISTDDGVTWTVKGGTVAPTVITCGTCTPESSDTIGLSLNKLSNGLLLLAFGLGHHDGFNGFRTFTCGMTATALDSAGAATWRNLGQPMRLATVGGTQSYGGYGFPFEITRDASGNLFTNTQNLKVFCASTGTHTTDNTQQTLWTCITDTNWICNPDGWFLGFESGSLSDPRIIAFTNWSVDNTVAVEGTKSGRNQASAAGTQLVVQAFDIDDGDQHRFKNQVALDVFIRIDAAASGDGPRFSVNSGGTTVAYSVGAVNTGSGFPLTVRDIELGSGSLGTLAQNVWECWSLTGDVHVSGKATFYRNDANGVALTTGSTINSASRIYFQPNAGGGSTATSFWIDGFGIRQPVFDDTGAMVLLVGVLGSEVAAAAGIDIYWQACISPLTTGTNTAGIDLYWQACITTGAAPPATTTGGIDLYWQACINVPGIVPPPPPPPPVVTESGHGDKQGEWNEWYLHRKRREEEEIEMLAVALLMVD